MSTSRAYIRLVKKLTVENLWLYIVKILMEEGRPLRAYDIKVRLREKFSIDPPAVTVYTVVYRMSRDGLLSRRQENGETLYSVTERGINAFKNALVLIEEILSKLKL
ncbi:PadR family transcriptional regulator [Desulfurococcus amylolyticus]|uniref:PadR family transcriptional regulator n=1 Tax=Desulfurococcus amylolyticus TaxID=94694 RepID=UPI0005B20824|nr:helix-turn-helix transcriptional regulator [Desulfurococcus amylolyticus]